MNKKLSIDVQCGELTCIDDENGDICDYLCENFAGRYCSFFNEVLKWCSDKNSMRCVKCKEAENAE